MTLYSLQPGDVVYAASAIYNDGGIPGIDPEALLASPGTRGVVVELGHLEADPRQEIFLVRFEDGDLELGPPTGVWPEELEVKMED